MYWTVSLVSSLSALDGEDITSEEDKVFREACIGLLKGWSHVSVKASTKQSHRHSCHRRCTFELSRTLQVQHVAAQNTISFLEKTSES
jgi:hypothetical protein